MLIKLFSTRNGATSAVNYCMGDKDHTGKIRSVKPKVLRGDPEYTKSQDKISPKVSSGVISFRDNEEITDEQKEKLLDDFTDTFIGSDMKDKVNVLFIEHQEKGNLEIHFIINKIAILDNAKILSFNAFPPNHQKLKNAFACLKNNELGFKQIEEKKALRTQFTSEEKKVIRAGLNTKNGFHNLKDKINLNRAMEDLIKSGEVKNRKELIEFLKDNGYKLNRIGYDYITIITEKGNLRFKGGIYSCNNDNNYKDIKLNFKEKSKDIDLTEQKKIYKEEMIKKVDFNKSRYDSKDNPLAYDPILKAPVDKGDSGVKAPKPPRIQVSHQAKPLQALTEHTDTQPLSTTRDTGNNGSGDDFKGQPEHTSSENSSAPVSMSSGGGTAGTQLSNALSQLANARTPQETVRAQQAVAIAKIAVEKENAMNRKRFEQAHYSAMNKKKF